MWRIDISAPLLHGIFFVSLTTTAGLIAVWAALSPTHRLLRLAGSCALPLALWFAPAPELVSQIVAEMCVIAGLLIAARFVARAPYGRTYASVPKVRFNLASLFYAIFLSGIILTAASFLGPQFAGWTPKQALTWFVEPLSNALAIFGAASFATVAGSRIKRLAALALGCVAGAIGWYLLIFVLDPAGMPGMAPGMFGCWLVRADSWYLSLVPCIVAAVVAAMLCVWRDSPREQSATETFRTRWQARTAAHWALLAAVTLPSYYLYYELVRPIPVPRTALPFPNGYEQLVVLGEQLADPATTRRQRDELLVQARQSLATSSLVSVNYGAWKDISRSRALRKIGYELVAKGESSALSGDVDEALAIDLDVLRLADRAQRGGIGIDALAGWAIESLAVGRLTGIAPNLRREQCSATARLLLAYDEQLESPQEVSRRDDLHSHLAYGWIGRWIWAVETRSNFSGKGALKTAMPSLRNRYAARLRALVCDLAIRAFELEHKRLPDSLDELVPEYLPAVPIDPFAGQAINFVKEPSQYTISSQEGGPNGQPFQIVRQRAGD